MSSSPSSKVAINLSARPLRVGYVALTDAAPLIVARELGIFSRHGLRVNLQREIGWATVREKVVYGELDAAHALAPMLWSAQLGLGCPPCEVLTALVLNLHGNALTLAQALWDAGVRDGGSLREHLHTTRRQGPLTLGVVFPYSSHHLLLLEWLREAGIPAERGVRIVVVPPAQMFRNLAAGAIDGYYVGEPWNSLAVRERAGWSPTWSAAQQPQHIEKVLMVTRQFAETRAAEHAALVTALAEACAWCDEAHHRAHLAELLARPEYLNLPSAVLTPSLSGQFDCGNGRIETVPGFITFTQGGANVPSVVKAAAMQRALGAAGLVPPSAAGDQGLPRRLFREDLHRSILHTNQTLHEKLSCEPNAYSEADSQRSAAS